MIDTDKYEGHTPAPWELMRSGPLRDDAPKDLENWWVKLNEARAKTSSGEWMRNIGNSYMTEADARLIADAPLLLAEVKRLSTLLRESNRQLELMTERFGVDKLVEMIEWDKTRRGLND
tara:strand:- start:1737 stop:2093 length:357 start_codon:yes stop_codon:yes gene_type:complete